MNYRWVKDPEPMQDVWNCLDEDGNRVAFIHQRPGYCNRGHFLGMVEIPGIKADDNWPNYYMRLDRAQEEIIAFLMWRQHKIRCVQPYGGNVFIAERTAEEDLELYGMAFTEISTGRLLDPKDICIHHPPKKD